MDFHLIVTNYVGSLSISVNGLFIILILFSPPENLGIFRSQYYAGAFTSFFYAATQLWSAMVLFQRIRNSEVTSFSFSTLMAHCYWCFLVEKSTQLHSRRFTSL